MAEAVCIDPQLLLVCIVLSLKQWCAAMLGCTALWTSWNRKDTVGSSNYQQHWCKLPQGTIFPASNSSDATDITAWTAWALGLNNYNSPMFLYARFVAFGSGWEVRVHVKGLCLEYVFHSEVCYWSQCGSCICMLLPCRIVFLSKTHALC
jgi:hypothetical protein